MKGKIKIKQDGTKIRCHECVSWQRGFTGMEGVCIKYETATGAHFACEGAVAKYGDKERAEKIRGHMEDMIRIANRHGYCVENHVSVGYLTMRDEAGEKLEIELLEMT